MDTHKQFFDIASDIEEASVFLEDTGNLLMIYDDQIWKLWKLVKALLPQPAAMPDANFRMIHSLITAIQWNLDKATAQTQQVQEKAYNLAAETAAKA